MTNNIIPTLSSCIDSIQLNLFDFGVGKPKFEQVLTNRFQSIDAPRNVNQALNLLADNHFEYVKSACPNCESRNVTKQGWQEINPILGEFGPQRIYMQKYKCKSCSKKFVTQLDSVIKPHHRYANVFADKLNAFIKTGYRSLCKAAADFQKSSIFDCPKIQDFRRLSDVLQYPTIPYLHQKLADLRAGKSD
jgi:transposase-like protein